MKKILILAILLIMLAGPVMADPGQAPNWHSDNSVAAYVDADAIAICGDNLVGFSEIGCVISGWGGPENYGLSGAARDLHGPQPPP